MKYQRSCFVRTQPGLGGGYAGRDSKSSAGDSVCGGGGGGVCVCLFVCVCVCVQGNGRPDHKVYFYDVEMDTITHFDFFTGRPPSGLSQTEDSERYALEDRLHITLPTFCMYSHRNNLKRDLVFIATLLEVHSCKSCAFQSCSRL